MSQRFTQALIRLSIRPLSALSVKLTVFILSVTLTVFMLSLTLTRYTSPQHASAEIVDRIVAIVGDEVITLSELLVATRPAEMTIRSTSNITQRDRKVREHREAMLEQLIGKSLLLQLAEEQGIEVTEAEVEATLQKRQISRGWSAEELERQLAREGLSVEMIKQQIREVLLQRRVVQVQMQGKLAVTDLELKDRYHEFVSRARGQKRVKGSHLLLPVPPGSTAAQEAAIKQRARELRERALRGEDFSTLVRKFGRGASASSGGDLGLISRGGGIPKELEDAFLALDAGQFSEPVRSAFGYHILWVREVLSASVPQFKDIKTQLHQELYEQKYQRALDEWILELKGQVFIERRL